MLTCILFWQCLHASCIGNAQDQLRAQKAAGRIFVGMREAPISFRPTYKFDKHTLDPLGYDTSEKRRVPAWTDRIFFRGTEVGSSRILSGPPPPVCDSC
jgi:hypothetical protein